MQAIREWLVPPSMNTRDPRGVTNALPTPWNHTAANSAAAQNGSVRPLKYHTLIEHGCVVGALTVAFHTPSIQYRIPSEKAGDAPLTHLGLRVIMGGDDHVLCDGSPAHLFLEKSMIP
ncbi:hypothetical protein EVAR_63997_1 [Eumeta japonica]|uniref:Uncharacterized protein n=1 Tax=Eumeta variegata TaxID=151549 RepID=A0A4C1Z1L6_EUMVA|nr:hypothetical protein EVAR_63997_1 [Eumeta japonica]